MAEKRFGETVPGGRYLNARGQLVNANGARLDDALEAPDATQSAIDLAEEEGIELADVEGTLAGGRIGVDDVRAAIEARDT